MIVWARSIFIAAAFINVDLPDAFAPVIIALVFTAKSLATGFPSSGWTSCSAEIPSLLYSGLHQPPSILCLYERTDICASISPANSISPMTSVCLFSIIFIVLLNAATSISVTAIRYSATIEPRSPDIVPCFLVLKLTIAFVILFSFSTDAFVLSSANISPSVSSFTIHLAKLYIFLKFPRDSKNTSYFCFMRI